MTYAIIRLIKRNCIKYVKLICYLNIYNTEISRKLPRKKIEESSKEVITIIFTLPRNTFGEIVHIIHRIKRNIHGIHGCRGLLVITRI